MRLIDAEALKKRAVKVVGMDFSHFKAVSTGEINHAPTIDAVPVVRCKDCNQWKRNVGFYDSPNGHCFYHDAEMNGFDFCSYGERKDGEG